MKKIFESIINFFKGLFTSTKKATATATNTVAAVIKQKPIIGELIRVCPGKNHAWYQSSVGPIRKPL